MYKGLLAGPAEARDPVEFRQLALFECEVAAPAPRREAGQAAAPRQLSLFDDAPAPSTLADSEVRAPSEVAVRVADIRWQGAHSVYLRDVTGLAVASWRRAGYEVVDMSGGRLEARDPRGA